MLARDVLGVVFAACLSIGGPRLSDCCTSDDPEACNPYSGCPGAAAQDADLLVTNPVSGDVFDAGGAARVEWESGLNSSYFDVVLLYDGSQVGEPFCDSGGCFAPGGILNVTLPATLDDGVMYAFLVGDRSATPTIYSASDMFQVNAAAGATPETSSSDEAKDGWGKSLVWVAIVGGVAGVVVVCALCVICRKCCCRPHANSELKSASKGQNRVVASSESHDRAPLAEFGPYGSSGGASDGAVSLASLGALSPVQEEAAEVETKNPMRVAMANGLQFQSAGPKLGSVGGADEGSKSQSSGGGDSPRTGEGEEDEETGGMFADADVVAKLAAAAASQRVGAESTSSQRSGDMTTTQRAGGSGGDLSRPGWHRSGGNWVRTASWSNDKTSPAGPVLRSRRGEENPKGPANAESAAGPKRVQPPPDWMVYTKESFESQTASEAAAAAAAAATTTTTSHENITTYSKQIAAGGRAANGERFSKTPSRGPEGKGNEFKEEAEPQATEEHTETDTLPSFSPMAATAASRSKGVPVGRSLRASLPAAPAAALAAGGTSRVAKGCDVDQEPECEVPKPSAAFSAGCARSKQDQYSWLTSSGMDVNRIARKTPTSTVIGAALQTPSAAEPLIKVPLRQQAASFTSKGRPGVSPPSVLPTEAGGNETASTPSLVEHCKVDAQGSKSGTPEQHETPALRLPPKAQVRAISTPRSDSAGAGRGITSTKDDWKSSSEITEPRPMSPRCSQPAPMTTPDRISRVSQVVEAFEKLTPRRSALTPRALAASTWTTPTATPDRMMPRTAQVGAETVTSRDRSVVEPASTPEGMGSKTNVPASSTSAPEELATGTTPSGAAGRGWSTPVATPDRCPDASAPDGDEEGATPERTASPESLRRTQMAGASPTDADESQFTWHLESPAGVDGLPSPEGSDGRLLPVAIKGGGWAFPTLVAAANPCASKSMLGPNPPSAGMSDGGHRLNSSDDSSAAGWEAEIRASAEPSYHASQISAFVADAREEAAQEARAMAAAAAAEAVQEVCNAEAERDTEAAAWIAQGTTVSGLIGLRHSATMGEYARNPTAPHKEHVVAAREVADTCEPGRTDPRMLNEQKSMVRKKSATGIDALQRGTSTIATDPQAKDRHSVEENAALTASALQESAELAIYAHAEAQAKAIGYVDGVDDSDADEDPFDGLAGPQARLASPSLDDFDDSLDSDQDFSATVAVAVQAAMQAEVPTVEDEPDSNVPLTVPVAGRSKPREVMDVAPQSWGESDYEAAQPRPEDEERSSSSAQSAAEQAAELAALVAEAIALADEDAGAHVPSEDDNVPTAPAVGPTSSKVIRGGANAGAFVSNRSILSWQEGEPAQDGDAERNAEEVQALVAEALALVKEAEDYRIGDE